MKKVTKLLCLFLVLTTALSLLVACRKDDESSGNPDEVKLVEVNLSEYSLIRSAKCGNAVGTAAKAFQKAMETALDKDFTSERDSKVPASAEAKEILVGLTDRAESTAAQTALGDKFAYSISVSGNKIVVTGATNELIVMGLNDLLENYAAKAQNGVVQIPETLTVEKKYHELVTAGKGNYNMVYSKSESGTENFATVRYILGLINEYTDENIEFKDDYLRQDESYDLTKKVIVVGNTNYPHSKELAKTVDLFGWAMESKDDLIYLCAYEKEALADMSGEFEERLANAVLLSTADAEKKTIRICEIALTVSAGKKVNTPIPLFTGGTADTFQQIDRGFYRMRYKNASKDDFDAYNAKLVAEGFSLYATNTLDSNVFNTYYKGDVMLHTYYTKHVNTKTETVSVVVAAAGSAYRFPLAPYGDDEVTNARLILTDMNYDSNGDGTYEHNNGMGFIFVMSDGSYVVVDGGHANDADGLYEYMKANNTREDGKILIRAWILTHPDGDHWGALNAFANKYGEQVTLEYYVTQYHYNSYYNNIIVREVVETLDTNMKKFGAFQRIVPLLGQKMFFGELEVDFLYTAELPTDMTMGTNEQSLIMSMSFKGKKILMMGDAMGVAATAADAIYNDAFKADYFQAAHHALNPCPIDDKSQASAVIFCTHKVAAAQRKDNYSGLLNNGAQMIVADGGYKTIIG